MALRYAPASTASPDGEKSDVGSREVYVDIQGFPNYQVSNLGNIWSKKTNIILKPHKTNRGYLTVGFWLNGKKKRLSIHRLVAQAFLTNPQNFPEVNHINGCKRDNSLCNLEWVSSSANVAHAYRSGLRRQKLATTDKELILQLLQQGLTHRAIGIKFNVSHSTVGSIARNNLI